MQYYVVRDKNTGLYFRGKGVNRWGKHFNQASIYRVKANAENTIKEVSWRGEQAEVVPIQIVETECDVAPIVGHNDPIGEPGEDGLESSIRYAKAEVAMELLNEIEKTIRAALILLPFGYKDNVKVKEIQEECYTDFLGYVAELKKKYTEVDDPK